MAQQVLTDARIYLGGYDLSGDLNQVKLGIKANILDNSTFASGSAKAFRAGLKSSTVEASGYWNDVGDAGLYAEIGAAAGDPITISPGLAVVGDLAFLLPARAGEYAPGAAHGEMLAFSFNAEGQSEAVRGQIAANSAITATGSGTGVNLGVPAKRIYVAFHVTGVTGAGATITAKVQSGATNAFAAPVDQITLTAATAIGGQFASVAAVAGGPWYRLVYTISGTTPSLSVVAAVGII